MVFSLGIFFHQHRTAVTIRTSSPRLPQGVEAWELWENESAHN